jgi:endonuclease/exonuclease/phosphatase (EEP) superfamily protein YafD
MLGALGRRSAGSDALEVLAGDFNATLDHAALRGLLHRLDVVDAADAAGAGLDMTWPADRSYPALIAIDHVLVDRRAAAREARTFGVAGSDHRALLAVLTVPRA